MASISDVLDYELIGDDLQAVIVTLDPGETVLAEAGAMMFMEDEIVMNTTLDPNQQGGGMLGKLFSGAKRVLSGDTFFVTTFANAGQRRRRVAFSSHFPGKIKPVDLTEWGGVIIALNQIFYRTALGRAFRATSDDPVTASLMGINPGRIFAQATGIAMVVVTIAALYLGMRSNFDPAIGPARLIYAFEAVIIGGLGSLWGTLAGGIIIGLAQTIGAAVNPEWQILAGHLAFLVVLLVRPRGLFPRAND